MAADNDEIPAVELISALARLDLEAAMAFEAAATLAAPDVELAQNLRGFARDHRSHLEALNETLESEGEEGVRPDGNAGGVLAGLLGLTGPLGPDVVVVTLLGNEQLTNLAYDAALSYDWDAETGAMLRRFQQDEERHVAWLAEKHERLGAGHEPQGPTPSA
jgi:rubrerythrin